MQPLWTFSELSAVFGVAPEGGTDQPVTGVSIDTRTLQAGDLFVALKDQRDGHDFVSPAFKAGAAAALVSESYVRRAEDGALFRVSDTLKALEALGRAARDRLSPDARVIAVTGSAGKTGTKEMLRACLSHLAATHASEKSYNNHWGVPLTLARMPRETCFDVFEIGMNHAGEIRPLTKMVRPHAAIITTVEAVHLEHFPSVEAIADAKGEIFEGLLPGGTARVTEQDGDQFEVAVNGNFRALTKSARQGAVHGGAISATYNADNGTEHAYYGRGYVQLTWWSNYAKAGAAIGRGLDLLLDPELVTEPDVAYELMSHGMRTGKGFANGHTLAHYFHGSHADYVNARAMVNGSDHAQDIAAIAKKFEKLLQASRLDTAIRPVPAPEVVP